MREKIVGVLLLLTVGLATGVALAQQQSMTLWAGTWKRNLAKSKFSGAPPAGEQTASWRSSRACCR